MKIPEYDPGDGNVAVGDVIGRVKYMNNGVSEWQNLTVSQLVDPGETPAYYFRGEDAGEAYMFSATHKNGICDTIQFESYADDPPIMQAVEIYSFIIDGKNP